MASSRHQAPRHWRPVVQRGSGKRTRPAPATPSAPEDGRSCIFFRLCLGVEQTKFPPTTFERMTKEDLLRLAQNPDFIAGIYHYCDRWCERCPFSARCLTFAMEQTEARSMGERPDPATFWTELESSLRATNELLQDLAREHGLKEVTEPPPLPRQARHQAGRHPLVD